MKHVIRILDRLCGEVSIETDSSLGLMLKIQLGSMTLSFGLDATNARKLAAALVDAADELTEGRDAT